MFEIEDLEKIVKGLNSLDAKWKWKIGRTKPIQIRVGGNFISGGSLVIYYELRIKDQIYICHLTRADVSLSIDEMTRADYIRLSNSIRSKLVLTPTNNIVCLES